ncbi:MAG: GEVED domain-containing protein, partial [Bacteroidales bacterium]|nr:GEVED domain-containing protein [Bacteroidales bacterium]
AWFYTQGIDLVAGTSYRLTFNYANGSTTWNENLKVAYGTNPVNTDMTNIIVDYPNIMTTTVITSTTDFTPSVSGTYYLGFNCYSNINQNQLYVDDILLDLSPSCIMPTDLFVNNTTTTSASLNWTQIGTTSDWNLKVTTSASFDPTTETGNIFDGAATGNPHALSGLTQNTTYYWYVQANCGVDDLSVWSEQVTFNTQCDAFAVPFTEYFDSYSIGAFPNCWARPVTYGTSTIFPSCVDGIFATPPYSLRFQSSITEPTYVVTPAFAEDINNLMLKFKLKASSTTSSGSIEVGVMSDPYDINTFELIQTITPNTTNWTDYTIYIINTTITGTNNHIAFKHVSASTSSYYYLENVEVQLLPDCPTPVNLYADITSSTSAELNWTQAGTCDTWNIKVSTTPITPATTDGDIIANESTMNNPYELLGLTENETYYFYVQADCGDSEVSDWSAQGEFYLGYCISTGNSSSYYINNFETFGGTDNISNLTSGYSTNGYQDATTMVVSQFATGLVNFNASFGSSTLSTFGLGVWVDWNNDFDFNDLNENVYISSSYNTTYSESFSVPAGIASGDYRMRVVANLSNMTPSACNATGINGETEDYTFTVIDPPACMPSTDLYADNITTTSANLNWTENGTATAWNIKVTTSDSFDPTTETGNIFDDVADGNPHTLYSLTGNTTYYWYVQANCGGGDLSYWSSQYEFTTECGIASIPYLQDFETAIVPGLPTCTTVQNAGSGNNWKTNNSTSYGFNSKVLNYSYNYSNAANTWFYTQGIQLEAGTSYRLTFNYTNGSTYWSESLKVAYGTSPENTAMTNNIVDHPNIASGTGITSTTDFTPIVSGIYYLGFNCYSDANQNQLYVDDILLDLSPSCPKPTELFADNITSTSASLNWTNNSSATSWTIKYSTTPIDPSVDPGDGELTTSSNPFDIPISSLTPNTTYYWYVQAICAVDDLSYWSDEDEFTTECLAVEFFDENFDGVGTGVLPDCWSSFTSPDNEYQTVQTSTSYSNSAPNGVNLYNSGETQVEDAPILISPILTNLNSGTKVLSFFARGAGSNTSIVVGTMSDPNDYSSFTQIETVTGLSTTTFTEYIVSFESYAGTDEYIALRHPMNSTYGTMYIDDIKLRLVSDENDILTFSFPEQTGPATITTGQIDIEISSLASLNALTPTITISDYATINPISGIEQDFTTSPFVYTVTSESNIDQTWNVYVTQATELSDQKDILTFTLPTQTGPAEILASEINIEVVWNSVLTNLTPTITISDLATVSPESGISTDFSLPVTYTVTAEDATTKDYTVNVTPEAIPAGATCTAAIDYGLINDPAITSTLAAGDNIWYTFTLDQDYANVVVSACGSDFDTRLGVYADCGDFTGGYGNAIGSYPSGTIGWDEDGCAGGEYGTGNSYASSIDLGTLTAGTYYAVLYGYAAASNGNTRFEVTGSNCVAPNTISASNLTATSADITWVSSVLNETSWNIKINEATAIADPSTTDGDIVPNALVETNPLYQIATGTLTEETDYYVYLQSACGSDWIDFMFTTPSSCPVPTGLTSSNIEANSATLSWTELGMEAWVIEISSTPLTDPDTQTGNIADNVDVTGTVGTYNATGLESNTTYYWYVKSACGSDWSAQEEFTTLCGTFSIPFTEDFTGVTTNELPLCWDQSHAHWSVQTSAEAGGTAPELEFDYNPTTTGELKVFTPVIDATTNSNLAMTFLHYVYHYQNSFDIKVEYTIDNGVTWTTAWDMTVTNDVSAEEVSVDLSSYVDGEVFQLAFVFDGNSFDIFNWNIDNINIFEATPPAIDQINLNSEVTDVNVCAGDDLATAIAALAPQMTISDTESNEYLVDLTWTIDAYDANTPAVYNATGTFELPTGVVQSDPVTPLEIGATVTVNALPVVTCPETMNVAVNTLVAFTGQTPAGGTFTGTGVVGDTFDPNGLDNGTYIITYTYTDPTTGCDNSCDFNVIVDVDISVADITVESIGIFPNPNKGEFTIDFSNIQGDVSYQVYDTKGSIIVQREIPTNGNTVEEVSVDLTPGVYYVKIVTTNQTFVEKLVIE